MSERSVDYEPVRGAAVSAALMAVPDQGGSVAMLGGQLREGALTTLLRAELMAAQAGIVPFFDLGPPLGKGVVSVGAARERLSDSNLAALTGLGGAFLTNNPTAKNTDADERLARLRDVRTVYLAAQGAVRRAGAFARPAKEETPRIAGHDLMGIELEHRIESLGLGPIVVVALVVMGVAAIAAGAWWAVKWKEKDVELEVEKARVLASTGTLSDLARTQIASGQPVDPQIIAALSDLGKREAKASWMPAAVLGAVGTVALGTGVYVVTRPKPQRRKLLGAV